MPIDERKKLNHLINVSLEVAKQSILGFECFINKNNYDEALERLNKAIEFMERLRGFILKLKSLKKEADAHDRKPVCPDCKEACSQRDSEHSDSSSRSYPVATGVIATQPETGSGLEEGVV